MYAAERQQRIIAEARRAGRVEVTALADSLGVAAETIRRDLTALERRGSLRRVHGGAIPVERLEVEPSLATRSGRLADVKRRIAARALDELPAGGSIILDAGSTTQAVAELLPPDLDLTVLTNSLAAATVLSTHPGISLYLLGGRVRGQTGAAVGEWTTTALSDVVVDVAFIGTNGLSVARGLTTPDQSEALVKRAMVAAARTCVVLTDSSKAGDDHLHRFAELADIDVVITDTDLDDDVAAEIRSAGPEVVTA
ncbi:D-beta-D-heptose 1-phosphate adenosyltransferase [Intrasporangium oryzae NRRL B-24470]|uniref:Lactose phosphotransferase system repressor n=1 Tax=Intrasporangium oryzae NRRL B-24470 TaxID=1386089 RepID=W9GB97_9MICO|nr:DeoR/GlpR family DNA-binding transcription regulator [Intrasporangium oryzae]EWT03355.1 D-beta-D-heptose 1-phosphate adenosyltransferase [Intrasporangium oryzae NRRL B-24470]